MYKIYFGEKTLVITNELRAPDNNNREASIFDYSKNDVGTVLKALRESNTNSVVLVAKDAEAPLDEVRSHFKVIEAGGGCVYTPTRELLLIFRRGKWDLPKGKLDEGETIEECAVREVAEETGLTAPLLEKKLDCTYHVYEEKGQTILKQSHWYMMSVPEKQILQPQLEEDIEQCEWVSVPDLNTYTANMQPSVKDILAEAVQLLTS